MDCCIPDGCGFFVFWFFLNQVSLEIPPWKRFKHISMCLFQWVSLGRTWHGRGRHRNEPCLSTNTVCLNQFTSGPTFVWLLAPVLRALERTKSCLWQRHPSRHSCPVKQGATWAPSWKQRRFSYSLCSLSSRCLSPVLSCEPLGTLPQVSCVNLGESLHLCLDSCLYCSSRLLGS